VPLWLWMVIAYASLLVFAALWAIIGRTRGAMLERKRRLPEATVRPAVMAERLTSEGSAPTKPARA
jgi:hypothetical protein